MSGNVCPTCHSPIEPARAPVARIRGSRVVTYCSPTCADSPAVVKKEPARVPEPVVEYPATVASERPRGNRKRQIIAISVAIMAGGMAITIINAVSPSTPSDVSAASVVPGTRDGRVDAVEGSASAGRPPGAAAAPAAAESRAFAADSAQAHDDPASLEQRALMLDPSALEALAKTTLRELLDSSSAQVQRIAATALARTGEPAALERLGALLEVEESELRQIDIAYALARAGDARGTKLLQTSLGDERRDVRLDAARSLVQLGDDSGGKVLRRMLSLSNHKIGAAALLARMGDEDGIETLRKALESSRSSEETRMRAVVALGRAGDRTVRDRLVEILEDGRFHVGAADALAALGDTAAVPALAKQLELASLRVRAASSLRRLGATVDMKPLAAALLSEGDPRNRISAAEAIIIITGPKQLAERE